jgi:ribonuclease HII
MVCLIPGRAAAVVILPEGMCANGRSTANLPTFSLFLADSKQLKESDRDKLLERLKADGRIGYAIEIISPEAISAAMMQRIPTSLNAISHDSAMNLIRVVMDQGVQVSKVYVDTVGDPGSYQAKLQRSFDRTITFTVSKKADSLFKTVSAASICAKVTRDAVLRDWTFKEPILAGKQPGAEGAGASGSSPKMEVIEEETNGKGDDDEEEEQRDFENDEEEDDEEEDVVVGRAAKRQKVEEKPAAASSSSSSSTTAAGSKKGATGGSAAKLAAMTASKLGPRSTDKAALHPKHAGSGYPGDPATKQWLDVTFDPVFGWPSVLRFSWATAKERLDAPGATPVEWEEDLDDGSGSGGKGGPGAAGGAGGSGGGQQMGLGSFFVSVARPVTSSSSSSGTAGGSSSSSSSNVGCGARSSIPLMARPPFFRKRHLKPVTDFL